MPKSLRLPWRTTAGLVACLLVAWPAVRADRDCGRPRNNRRIGRKLRAFGRYAGRSGGPRRRAAQRSPFLHPAEPEARARSRTPAGRQGRVGPRRRRPARPGALRRAHAVRGLEAFPGTEHRPPSCRRSAWASARTRTPQTSFDDTQYILRVPADRAGHPRHGADRARRLGGRRALRSRGHRAPASDRPRRMATQPRRQRTDRREVAPRAAGGIALRGPNPDWDPVGDRDRARANS